MQAQCIVFWPTMTSLKTVNFIVLLNPSKEALNFAGKESVGWWHFMRLYSIIFTLDWWLLIAKLPLKSSKTRTHSPIVIFKKKFKESRDKGESNIYGKLSSLELPHFPYDYSLGWTFKIAINFRDKFWCISCCAKRSLQSLLDRDFRSWIAGSQRNCVHRSLVNSLSKRCSRS